MELSEFNKRFHHLRNVVPEKDFPLRTSPKLAAVLIPIIKRHELSVLFTVRASHLNNHAGQISFPGGRYDDTDLDLTETALRESEEEIGLDRKKVSIVGKMPPFRTISRYRVTPYVGLVSNDFELTVNASEVDEVFEVPLAYLMNDKNILSHKVKRHNYEYPVYFIPWQDKMIWGATAAFVKSLSNHLA